jgi:peroxiredoxin
VLYFFPKANTGTCDLEAHLFSEKTDDFKKLGASVIGMSADNQAVLQDFSTLKCGGKFPVATANAAVRKAYDLVLAQKPEWASRTSYVIAPNGKIVMEYTDLKDASSHVEKTYAALQALKGKYPLERRDDGGTTNCGADRRLNGAGRDDRRSPGHVQL